jgi:hypothetical protein
MKALAFLLLVLPLRADTTIVTDNPYAYSANLGWINVAGDKTSGAVIGEFYCSGSLYSANAGWIKLGSGAPASGHAYANTTATDYGVNTADYIHTGRTVEALLRGYAWGANIGWIKFENTGNPRVDLSDGRLLGSIWSANTGWISLDGAAITVLTATLDAGPDTDADNIPDAWEFARQGDLTSLTTTGDLDADGYSDFAEYLADTHPRDPAENLALLDFTTSPLGINQLIASFRWSSRLTRLYDLESSTTLTPDWTIALGNIAPESGGTTSAAVIESAARKFYRITPRVPLRQ